MSQTSSSFTQATDGSGSSKSIQSSKTNVSNAIGQIFTKAAMYKGSIVAVRKVRKDSIKITRKIQLEMSKVGQSLCMFEHINLVLPGQMRVYVVVIAK